MSGCVFSNSAITCLRSASSVGLDDHPESVTVVAFAVLVPAWALATTSTTAAIEARKADEPSHVILLLAPVPVRAARSLARLSAKAKEKCVLTHTSDHAYRPLVESVSRSSPRISDVAQLAGVGKATVSRVLNGHVHVRPSTRERVLEAIRTLEYRPSATARNLALGRTMVVVVIVPFFTNPSVVERVRGVVEALGRSAYDMMLFDLESEDRQHRAFQLLDRSDGLLVVSTRPSDHDVDAGAPRARAVRAGGRAAPVAAERGDRRRRRRHGSPPST